MKNLLLLIILILLSGIANAQGQPPEWFTNHIEHMLQGPATWIADNSEYQSSQEPIEAFATEWSRGLDNRSLTGRLYGIIDGEETGTYWEFRTFWNPVDKKVYAYQFGSSGAIGMGEMTFRDEGVLQLEQNFYNPDGSTSMIGHESEDLPGVHETRSFTISENGEWTENRFYVWELNVNE